MTNGLRQRAKAALPPSALALARSLRRTLTARLPQPVIAVDAHRRTHKVFPRLVAPRTFNEKILHRKLFDRRPLLSTLADKLAARAYVAERLDPDILPRLYTVTTDPTSLPFSALPDRFVVKPTHGSGWVWIVRDKATVDRAALIDTCRQWLATSYYDRTGEWIYKNVPPRILIEELIEDGSGIAPTDYKLFTFDG
ncbi:MAG TPA: ATP-grasp fold amidoligase family protein, partial [Polyangia bacterium]|nr:ATP-grasp fold amidoligase family protein [Polyangia bacterium]